MKKQFVNTLQEGDRVNDCFVAARKDLREQQNGNKFLGMVFKDRTGEVGGILWNNAASVARLFEVGDAVNVKGVVTTYQDRLQIRVDQVLPLRESEYSLNDLMFVPDTINENVDAFRKILGTIANEFLSKLVASFLDDEPFMARFTQAAAGKKWHHGYCGGLLQHCVEMARLAQATCDVLPEVDRDIVLAGVLLHDIGKVEEMSHGLNVEYTTAGRLLGHLVIATRMVDERIAQIPGFPETLRLHVLHCILAHHGELVNGSPIVPKTIEALVLYHLDNLDAQADAFARVVRETREKGQTWSEYIGLIDRPIWTRDED